MSDFLKNMRKHITPSTLIALLALIFALTGGAFAATGGGSNGGSNTHSLTASAAKSKSKGAKGPRGARGPAGPAGPAGKNGATGAAGATGAQGPAGAKGETGAAGEQGKEGEEGPKGTSARPVTSKEFTGEIEGHCKEGGSEISVGSAKTYACNGHEGKNGTFGSEPLPPGQTLTGVWAGNSYAEKEGIATWTATSFADPIDNPKIAENEHMEYIKEGGALPEHCTGSAEEPGAVAGYLCIFAEEESNVSAVGPLDDNAEGHPIAGFTVQILSGAIKGQFLAHGTWAVTGCNPALPKGEPLACKH